MAAPTARLTGAVQTEVDSRALRADLGVQVGTPGRYEVRAVLMGTNREGQLEAVAVGHSANWLEAGNGNLSLSFDAALLKERGLTAPYEINDLRLIHQDRMSLLHRQAQALRFQ